ncbi:MAG: cell division protein FtsQ [Candidatus Nephrothrix sp. EaCA]|nr:MAG: cell division protein FtsQ [Candidatus Nephrothrix sp. EaCA]
MKAPSYMPEIKMGFALLGICFFIAFVESKQSGVACSDIIVELDNEQENYFLDEKEVKNLILNSGQRILGTSMSRIHLRELEARMRRDKHVLRADIFGDMKGNLIVGVKLRQSIARLVQSDAPDAYVATDGVIMPVSDKFTPRVLLISGAKTKELLEKSDMKATEDGKKLFAMIEFINGSPFWKAQIAQLDVNKKSEIVIYPQITSQRVEFGTPDDAERKFHKLMIFYKQILPQQGWNQYTRVNLEYEGQIVAERALF